MNTEARRDWRGIAALSALFIGSFGATLWVVQPQGQAAEPTSMELTAASTPGAALEASISVPVPMASSEPEDAAQPAVPSLHELATDADPATREEAGILLGLIAMEQSSD